MIQQVTLPKLGETVQTSIIDRWRKKEGDPVAVGDVLCEITTDKATLEVESFQRGTLLKIVAPTGVELAVGSLIAVVGDPGEKIPEEWLKGGAGEAASVTLSRSEGPSEGSRRGRSLSDSPEPQRDSSTSLREGRNDNGGGASETSLAPAARPTGTENFHRVTLPKLGETVEVSIIERWRKKEGDTLGVGDILCEITTDKATLEVENYQRGTLLKILAPEKKELPVGALIAIIGEPGTVIPDEVLAEAGVAPASVTLSRPEGPSEGSRRGRSLSDSQQPQRDSSASLREGRNDSIGGSPETLAVPVGRIFASPRARRMAKELLVRLDHVKGTGPGGRIVEDDVTAVARGIRATPIARKLAAEAGVDLAAVAGGGHAGKVTREDVLRAAESPAAVAAPETAAAAPEAPATSAEVIPLTAMRRVISTRMLESKMTTPCYYLEMDADVTDLVCLRNKLNLKGAPCKIGFNDFVLKACAMALRQFPIVNSRWVPGGIQRRGEVNVGFAVALDDGLLVPVVKNVDKKPLRDICVEAGDLATRARTKRLRPDEFQGGCLTVSNLGMYGIRSFIPVVNPGESTILGLGMVDDRVVFRQGGIQVRKIMAMTLAVDHRLIDGAVGAQFLEAIRDGLEAPAKLVE